VPLDVGDELGGLAGRRGSGGRDALGAAAAARQGHHDDEDRSKIGSGAHGSAALTTPARALQCGRPMNAIALLKMDHRAVEELFDKIEQLSGKSRGKKSLVEKIVRELSIHTAIEEQIFYPEVRKGLPDATGQVFDSLEEHNVIKWLLNAVESAKIDDERFDAKLKVLRDAVLHHVDEEENELFPRVREAFGTSRLNELGASLERAKKEAPTRPHPRVPDEPPANIVASRATSRLDRLRDAGRKFLRGRGGVRQAAPAKRERRRGGRASQ
jgi:hemerythrin superfamily protein